MSRRLNRWRRRARPALTDAARLSGALCRTVPGRARLAGAEGSLQAAGSTTARSLELCSGEHRGLVLCPSSLLNPRASYKPQNLPSEEKSYIVCYPPQTGGGERSCRETLPFRPLSDENKTIFRHKCKH